VVREERLMSIGRGVGRRVRSGSIRRGVGSEVRLMKI
jgi:hypothetical protein